MILDNGELLVNAAPPMIDTFTVVCELDGATHSFSSSADQTVLSAAEAAGVAVPSSCCSGVCTTCAAVIKEGSVHQPDAKALQRVVAQVLVHRLRVLRVDGLGLLHQRAHHVYLTAFLHFLA